MDDLDPVLDFVVYNPDGSPATAWPESRISRLKKAVALRPVPRRVYLERLAGGGGILWVLWTDGAWSRARFDDYEELCDIVGRWRDLHGAALWADGCEFGPLDQRAADHARRGVAEDRAINRPPSRRPAELVALACGDAPAAPPAGPGDVT